jgi:putative spermidine/putrescine transport system permease protein
MSGLVLANVMLGLPYVITSVVAGLQSFDPAQEMVARSLGMNRLRSFFVVTLPQIKASVLTGAIFAFISAMDETLPNGCSPRCATRSIRPSPRSAR